MQIKFRVTYTGSTQDLTKDLRKQYDGILCRHLLDLDGIKVVIPGRFGRCTYILSECTDGCAVWQYIGGAGDFLTGEDVPECVEAGAKIEELEILYINPGDGSPIVGNGSLTTYLKSRLKKWSTVRGLIEKAKRGDVDMQIALCKALESDPKFAARYL